MALVVLTAACGGVIRASDPGLGDGGSDPDSDADIAPLPPTYGEAGPGFDANQMYTGCPRAVTAMDIAEVNPPKGNTQGSCTDSEIALVGKVSSGDLLAKISPSCASCIFTESDDMTNTQFFVWADAMHEMVSLVNYGACPGTSQSGGSPVCGRAVEELETCIDAACPRDANGASTCTDLSDQDCVTAAIAGDCKQYDDKQLTGCGGATALKGIFDRCFDSQGNQTPGITLLCGGAAATDGG